MLACPCLVGNKGSGVQWLEQTGFGNGWVAVVWANKPNDSSDFIFCLGVCVCVMKI